MLIKPNALALMSRARVRASAVTASLITWSLMSFQAVYSQLRWRRPTTALSPGLSKSTLKKLKVVRQADLGYIINHEQEKKGSCLKTPAQEKEAGVKTEGCGSPKER